MEAETHRTFRLIACRTGIAAPISPCAVRIPFSLPAYLIKRRGGGKGMKGDPVQRAVLLGEYIVQHGATVRAAAAAFGCSKSTVHKDVINTGGLHGV